MDAVEFRRLRYRLRSSWQRSPAGPAENPPFPGCTSLGGRGGDFHFLGGSRGVIQEAMRFTHRTGSGSVYIFFKFAGGPFDDRSEARRGIVSEEPTGRGSSASSSSSERTVRATAVVPFF